MAIKLLLNNAWRKRLLMAALLLTLWGVWEVSQEVPVSAVVSERVERKTRRPPAPSTVVPQLPLVWPTQPVEVPAVTDMFSPPPPPVVTGPVSDLQTVVTPTFNYKYIGHLVAGDTRDIFLVDPQDRVTTTRVGLAVDNDWQLIAETSTQLTFKHTATRQQITLQIGPTQ
jgi:hypothetical protein